ncbi:FAD/NAD(P)-binding protein [Sphingomonas sp.]|uniref:FAD/NAD(P)-binding protein n=1 Tax=Sphingomonas sp. TaxID=28214 RepID=UPI00286E424C|nr:FAD/NAD(P)-binding protein [Sphingomonas sp.]
MKSDRRAPVAIIGGGFSGTMLAAQLARRGIGSMLIDGSGRAGLGTAYSTAEPAHLLNVRAEGMSAWPDAPGDFADYFVAEGGDARGFAERRLFGRYLRGILDGAVASGHVDVIESSAVAADRGDGGWVVTLDDGRTLAANVLALANGNQPPEPMRGFEAAGPRFIGNPWGSEAKAAVAALAADGGDALVIGTGLTMVDTVLSLAAAGHQGRIVAVSRRGLIPRGHAEFSPAPVAAEEVPHGDLVALWRWLRRRAGEVGWRAAVDGLRPYSAALWQALDEAQQRRFLRHARPWWDVHRHRIAPEVSAMLRELVAAGRLEIVAGRIGDVRSGDGCLEVAIRRRGRPAQSVYESIAYAFNCTGPLGAIERTRDPLLRGLLDAGLVTPDVHGMGLAIDDRNRAGQMVRAVGPLTKGRYWEIVAVPDIRGQAAAVAADIAAELER